MCSVPLCIDDASLNRSLYTNSCYSLFVIIMCRRRVYKTKHNYGRCSYCCCCCCCVVCMLLVFRINVDDDDTIHCCKISSHWLILCIGCLSVCLYSAHANCTIVHNNNKNELYYVHNKLIRTHSSGCPLFVYIDTYTV